MMSDRATALNSLIERLEEWAAERDEAIPEQITAGIGDLAAAINADFRAERAATGAVVKAARKLRAAERARWAIMPGMSLDAYNSASRRCEEAGLALDAALSMLDARVKAGGGRDV